MRLLFAHDHYFHYDNQGNYYSPGKLPYVVWQRYLSQFDQITVASRMRSIEGTNIPAKFALSSGAGVSFLQIPSLSSLMSRFIDNTDAKTKLEDAMESCDALVARLPSEIGALAVKTAIRLQKPWAIEVVACAFDSLWNYGTWQGKVYAPYATWTMKRLISQAPYVLYVTKEFLQARYPTSGISVACSNVELPVLDPNILTNRLKRIVNPRKTICIGLIGALNRIKGIETALKAVALAKCELPPLEFRILGEGDDTLWREMAEQYQIHHQTVFCGTLPNGPAVYEWLDDIDIYIQPSYQEGLPRALIEAMSRGCPALGSSAGGIPELLHPKLIHKPGDSHRLAFLLKQIISDNALQEEQAIRNFATATHYVKPVIDQIRGNFWAEFARSVR